MWWLLTGALAAAVVWPVNSWLARRFGSGAMVLVAPLLEECAKTGLAVAASAPVVLAHAWFGALEGLYEIWREKKAAAGGMGFISHLLLGVATVEIYRRLQPWPGSVAGAFLLHAGWNGIIFCCCRAKAANNIKKE